MTPKQTTTLMVLVGGVGLRALGQGVSLLELGHTLTGEHRLVNVDGGGLQATEKRRQISV